MNPDDRKSIEEQDLRKVGSVIDHIIYVLETCKLTFAEWKLAMVWVDAEWTYRMGAKASQDFFDFMVQRQIKKKEEEKEPDHLYG